MTRYELRQRQLFGGNRRGAKAPRRMAEQSGRKFQWGGGYGDLIHGEFKMAPLDGRVLAYTDIMIRGEYKEAQA